MVKNVKSVAGKIIKIYVSFDDNPAGLTAMSHDDLPRRHQWVPIERTKTSFSIRKKVLHHQADTVSIDVVICMLKLLYVLIYIGRNH